MQEIKYEELDLIQQNLLDEAAAVMETAYNPYSHFYVGAALLSLDGQIITGSNVENAAIIGRGESFDTTEVTAPCGSCRQMLFESSQVSERNLELIMATTRKDKIILATMEEILPLAFGPKDLGIDVRKYQ